VDHVLAKLPRYIMQPDPTLAGYEVYRFGADDLRGRCCVAGLRQGQPRSGGWSDGLGEFV
jgi:hypothetical protein